MLYISPSSYTDYMTMILDYINESYITMDFTFILYYNIGTLLEFTEIKRNIIDMDCYVFRSSCV